MFLVCALLAGLVDTGVMFVSGRARATGNASFLVRVTDRPSPCHSTRIEGRRENIFFFQGFIQDLVADRAVYFKTPSKEKASKKAISCIDSEWKQMDIPE